MNIGWVGLGKLGLPCAAALAKHHTVWGYDVRPEPKQYVTGDLEVPYREQGIEELFAANHKPIIMEMLEDVVVAADVIFVAVQTPHAPQFEGDKMMLDERADFDYSYLAEAVREIAFLARARNKWVDIVVVSTVLPGTMERVVKPLLNRWTGLIYSPAFIAMGTTIQDFENPEFVLVGADDARPGADPLFGVVDLMAKIYEPIHDRPIVPVSIASAELAKVAYNTYIGQKIVFANTLMEICHKTAADVDEIHAALSFAGRRLHSSAYLKGGMGDGGGCHPRDNIALSWLARRLDLSVDWFEEIMDAREQQTRWLAELARHHAQVARLPIVVLGKAYKPETNLTVGSPATLLTQYLDQGWGFAELDDHGPVGGFIGQWDPHVDHDEGHDLIEAPAVFVVATRHPEFEDLDYPSGSVIVDPWGYISDRRGATVIRVGRKS